MSATVINKDSKLKSLPKFSAGESDFQSIMLGDFTYVDKTHFIKKWWDSGVKINLIVRPRRFSKTTIMSMVKSYFQSKDLKFLFGDTYIYKNASPGLVGAHGHVIPILLTFKDVNGKKPNKLYKSLYNQLKIIRMDPNYREMFTKYVKEYDVVIKEQGETLDDCEHLLDIITFFFRYIYTVTGKKLIILVDEYDKFLADAASVTEKEDGDPKYFGDVLDMYRSFLVNMLKDTDFVERAILTGVLPLAANSVLSAFNNAVKDTFLQSTYDDIFGFTYEEIAAIFSFDKNENWKEAIARYDSYSSGNHNVYNTWSIINMIKTDSGDFLQTEQSTWVNSGNTDWIKYSNNLTSEELSTVHELITGGEHVVRLNHDFSYQDRKDSLDNFLTYAFYAGYLTFTVQGKGMIGLAIPNDEVREAWISNLDKLIVVPNNAVRWDRVLRSLEEDSRSEEMLENILTELLEKCVSTWDVEERDRENSYHMYILGLLGSLVGSHDVKSNREGGKGRFDIAVMPLNNNGRQRNYVFEIKRSNSEKALQRDVDGAVQQVIDNRYRQFFENRNPMVIIGLAAYKKTIKVKIKVVPYKDPRKQSVRLTLVPLD
ncbi:AAA family ATPase [Paenibacillus sp. UASWS1643]|uniref:AAA family ATPase n=1 Tax=Paenibacillus sp. UASWS1643 TaxID=2580422 RepID=UPI0016864549|nr:AAA family ATPase [Paenibacillus sp. UASWS1643]